VDGPELKRAVIDKGFSIGFDQVGFAQARLDAEDGHLAEWLRRGFHGEMQWMGRRAERRTDATESLPGSATVICCALNYYQGPPEARGFHGVVSSYARGRDYHAVMEPKLSELAGFVENASGAPTKLYVDTGPVLEKPYAAAAGLGWQGKHSNLISRAHSSWLFLGEILVPLELPIDAPAQNHCGSCERCLDACPTGAIVEPYVVDSRLCISYLTIELRGFIPEALRPLIGDRIYGCDDCQDVCPWNRFAKKSAEAAFFAREPLRSMDLAAMLRMSREEFMAATKASAIRRARYAGFLRNVAVALGNSDDVRAVPPLLEALRHDEALVRGHAAWALGHLKAASAAASLRARLETEVDDDVRLELRQALERLDVHL